MTDPSSLPDLRDRKVEERSFDCAAASPAGAGRENVCGHSAQDDARGAAAENYGCGAAGDGGAAGSCGALSVEGGGVSALFSAGCSENVSPREALASTVR